MSDDKAAQPAEEVAGLNTEHATMRATVQVTRKATGKVETFELVGKAEPIPAPNSPKAR